MTLLAHKYAKWLAVATYSEEFILLHLYEAIQSFQFTAHRVVYQIATAWHTVLTIKEILRFSIALNKTF